MKEISCPNCGKMIPESAHFCPFCEKSFVEKKEAEKLKKVPRRTKKALVLAAVGMLVLLSAVFVLWRTLSKRVSAETRIKSGGKEYRLVLRNSVDFNHISTPQELAEKKILGDRQGALPSQLYVFDAETGANAKEEFRDLVESVSVTVKAVSGSEVSELGSPAESPGFPDALYETDVIFSGAVQENRIAWHLVMKDGKKAELSHTLRIISLSSVTYDYRTTALDSMTELQALIREIDEKNDQNTVVTVNLGPYVYSGDLSLSKHSVNLCGTEENGQKTTIDGMLSIRTNAPFAAEFSDLVFTGGNGVGIEDGGGAFMTRCEFDGLDTGILVVDGGYAMPSDCIFRNCRIGLHFNSSQSNSKRPMFDGNQFLQCGTGILLQNVPGEDVLMLPGCVFEGNGTDIDNRTAHVLEME